MIACDMHLPSRDQLDSLIGSARAALSAVQKPDGHWVFELEADSTIPSEYIMLRHFLGDVQSEDYRTGEARIANYIRAQQKPDGGWPLFADGDMDLSATVKSYLALKLAGDSPDAPHMAAARARVLEAGGAAKSNMFTRISLALFGQVPWKYVPCMPVEIMLLPQWFPFHLSKVSYWSRTVIVPLLILMELKPRAANPRGVRIDELFRRDPAGDDYAMNGTGTALGALFAQVDRVLRLTDPLRPRGPRKESVRLALDFVTERLNGEDGVGGIFPAMANTVMAYEALGYDRDHPDYVIARQAVEKLVTERGPDQAYVQPCLSPVWDTCLAAHAMMEAGEPAESPVITGALDWLLEREITEVRGDWSWRRPELSPAGWAFQYQNAHYPDVDDTAVVVLAMHRSGNRRYADAVRRAADWIIGMQSSDGGWGSFDPENTHYHLNYIPFADHGALLDPPTVDVTARCLGMLAQLGYGREHPAIARGLEFLRREQEDDGSWYGRWGVNYVYGTWSALCAFNACGEDMQAPHIQKAVAWLKARQLPDGGWGEDCASYWPDRRDEVKGSTPSQTAWAMLGLMAAGEVDSPEVERGALFLQEAPRDGARWEETLWTGIGFPRVFYLKYHGYAAYFPLWALARYRNLKASNDRRVHHGI